MAALGLLSACAESAATPDTVAALNPATKASLKIATITDEAGPGVALASFDLDRIRERIKADITAAHPGILASPKDPPANDTANMKIIITRYDSGSAFARFMIAGLGQIHIDGDVIFTNASTGRPIGEYKVSKDFAFGGVYGATTKIEDVEKGFAKSVAEIFETKQSSILKRMNQG
jgi:Domain of unknown function (DUF4410)